MKLLSRSGFREAVFTRDSHTCVVCSLPAVDAHHILERRLFPDGGYYLDNGASVCAGCHLLCEQTEISVEQLREVLGITRPVLPPHLYSDVIYDKWGNILLPNGTRLRGELFWDESVQKVLAGVLHLFVDKVKYPRTYHLPWSQNIGDDDRVFTSMDSFIDQEVVVTEKMDGENTTMYRSGIHARSVDSLNHPSRNWVKNFWSQIRYDIPEGWRICGENLYAQHSIAYSGLPSYFMGFSIWDEANYCLPWYQTLEWFDLLGITPVPVLYRGEYQEKIVRTCFDPAMSGTCEGYVMRLTGGFSYRDFRSSVGKYVRLNHNQTVKHWMHGQAIVPNGLDKRQ